MHSLPDRNKLILKKYLPEPAAETIAEWIYKYNFKLRIKKSRSSKEGDYTPPYSRENHLITINRDLNPYAFLITIVHEVAHLITWEKHRGKVNPHGKEWKSEYSKLLNYFLEKDKIAATDVKIFPKELFPALQKHIQTPSAASCSDLNLSRALRKYDSVSEALLLEKISAGSLFRIAGSRTKHSGEMFIKGQKRRTRYKCMHAHTKQEYLLHALCKVILITNLPGGK